MQLSSPIKCLKQLRSNAVIKFYFMSQNLCQTTKYPMNKTLDHQRLKSLTSQPTKRTAKLPNIRLHHSQKVSLNQAAIPPNQITLRLASLLRLTRLKLELTPLLLPLKLIHLPRQHQIRLKLKLWKRFQLLLNLLKLSRPLLFLSLLELECTS